MAEPLAKRVRCNFDLAAGITALVLFIGLISYKRAPRSVHRLYVDYLAHTCTRTTFQE